MKMNLNLGVLGRNVMKRNRVDLPEWSCGVYSKVVREGLLGVVIFE